MFFQSSLNGKDFKEYFDTEFTRLGIEKPFKVCPVRANYNIDVNVSGGGKCSQSGAITLGISRALLVIDSESRQVLRNNGLLTVDSRVKERKKYGQRGARRKFQFTKR